MRYRHFTVAFAILVSVPVGVRAQARPQGQAPAAEPASPAAVVNSLKAQLRNLVVAQEAFYAGKSSYSNSLKDLGYVAREGAYVMVFRANAKGWAGRAVHPSLPGTSCVIWVGEAEKDPPKTDATQVTGREGEPICDAP